jgi:hypothetical protein
MTKHRIIGLALAGAIATSGVLMAAVTFDAATGTGFVGKGDVQLALGLNNKALQEAANADAVEFQATSTVVTEVSWVCTNSNNQNTQERERTTTTTVSGVLDSTARERNQVTGFILGGYDGTSDVTTTTEGNQLNSCPGGPWSLTTPAGDPVVVEESSAVLQVKAPGFDWTDLP